MWSVFEVQVKFKSFGPIRRALDSQILYLDMPEGSVVRDAISRVVERGGVLECQGVEVSDPNSPRLTAAGSPAAGLLPAIPSLHYSITPLRNFPSRP